jgi:hypothetical protein
MPQLYCVYTWCTQYACTICTCCFFTDFKEKKVRSFPERSFRDFFLKMYAYPVGSSRTPHPAFPPDLFLYLNSVDLKKISALIIDAHIKVFVVKKTCDVTSWTATEKENKKEQKIRDESYLSLLLGHLKPSLIQFPLNFPCFVCLAVKCRGGQWPLISASPTSESWHSWRLNYQLKAQTWIVYVNELEISESKKRPPPPFPRSP